MGSMVTIYRKKNYRIYDANDGYIVYNTNLDFESHHTHINNFHTCKYVIDLCIHKTVPYHLSDYLLISILRLSNDKGYNRKIEEKLEENKRNRFYKNKRNHLKGVKKS